MLPSPQEDLARRRWVWQALANLFLDEEMTEDTRRYIARVIAECDYTDEEMEVIYRWEVAPAVAINTFSPAGVWGYWDSVWLEEMILRPPRLGYWFDRFIVAPLPLWILRHEWRQVKKFLVPERERVRKEQEKLGDHYKPIWYETVLSVNF